MLPNSVRLIRRRSLALRSLILCLLLSACALQPKVELGIEQRIAQLQSEHRFGAAQRSIERESTEVLADDKKQQLLADNAKQANDYERRIIALTSTQQQNEEWAKAGTELNRALSAFPESAPLVDAHNAYLEARDDFLRDALQAHREKRAQRIPDELESLSSISGAGGGPDYTASRDRLQKEAENTAVALLVSGQKLLAKKRWREAQKVLKLSKRLQEDSRTDTALRVAARNIKPLPSKRKTKPTNKPIVVEPENIVDEPAVAAAMHRYRYELQRKNFAQAKEHISKAQQLSPDDQNVAGEYRQFLSLLNSNAKQHVEQGKYHYSLGDIDTAITHWETAYALTPNDDALKERLQKARRFKTRYEQLKR